MITAVVATGAGSLHVPEPSFHEPTATEVTAAKTLLSSIQAPAGATRDLYGTACAVPYVSYCLTSSRSTPEQLLNGVLADFRSHGASVKGHSCAKPAKAGEPSGDLLGRCRATVQFRGAELLVVADDTTAFGVKNPSWLYVIPPTLTTGIPSDGPAKPLGTWESLRLLPPGWTGTAACTVGTASACTGYKLTATHAGKAATLMTTVRETISHAGYRVDTARCFTQSKTVDASCFVAATRFLAAGGKDMSNVIARTRQTNPSTTTLTMNVGDIAPPNS